MPTLYTGRREARFDARIAHFSAHTQDLPPAPQIVDWGDAVQTWGMLGNDQAGDCVWAAAMHEAQQVSTYAGNPLNPTTEEAIKAYSDATGYVQGDDSTDNGTFVMGAGGAMELWHKNGITIGGKLNKCGAYLQIAQISPKEWMQAIYYFGGIMLGINLPKSIITADQTPFLWNDPGGPSAGGHEIWVNGYRPGANGMRVYSLISWGARYTMTEDFMEKVFQEAVTVYNPISINARGVDASGLNADEIVGTMNNLHGEDQEEAA